MNETTFSDGVLVEQTVDHGDGTGTRTTFDADGNVTGTEELSGLPIPPPPEPDPLAVLQAQLAAQQATIDALLDAAAQATIAAVVADPETDPEVVAEVTGVFNDWRTNTPYRTGAVAAFDGTLWRCVQAHTSQDDWAPPVTPALWAALRVTSGPKVDEWVQPTNAEDVYELGDRVRHNGKTWESTATANVWEPGVYGWIEVV